MEKLHYVPDEVVFEPSSTGFRGVLVFYTQEGDIVNLYLPERVEDELRRRFAETGS